MKARIRVLHLSTHNEDCGIAIFQQNIVGAMGDQENIVHTFFSVSPNQLKLLRGNQLDRVLNELFEQLKDFDILHIQHEYSFFNDNQLQRIVHGAKSMKKKVVFTLHTPPHAHRQNQPRRLRPGVHPRSWLHAWRVAKADRRFIETYIRPLHFADCLIATSRASIESFADYGVPRRLMKVIELPVPNIDASQTSSEVAQKLHKRKGDVLLSMTGFISETKGTVAALKALQYLPQNYKLAIIGGSHPSGQNDIFYDQVADLILALGIKDRVYITGYVKEDAKRDALLRETDICLFPYDHRYYDYVASAALTNAVANRMPVVAYKTRTFLEANETVPFINFSQSANYYELVRTITSIDIQDSIRLTNMYARSYSVETQALLFAKCYFDLVK